MLTYQTLANSTYLDLTSYESNDAALPIGTPVSSGGFNAALVLQRANSPDDLLNADWASRQKQIAELNQAGTLWDKYGADPAAYAKVVDQLHDLGIHVIGDGNTPVNAQYVSSPASRTIWVHLDATSFTTLFGPSAALLEAKNALDQKFYFWGGDLSLPKNVVDAGVVGLWLDSGHFSAPVLADPGAGQQIDLPSGSQSAGNSSLVLNGEYPQAIAERYNFPFAGKDLFGSVKTGTVGLIEPHFGDALPDSRVYAILLQNYLKLAGVDARSDVTSIAAGGQTPPDSSERELDAGIASAVNPLSPLVFYAGSGSDHDANSEVFTAYESAIWDTVNNPAVVSSSFSSYNHINPGAPGTPLSPFYLARYELFVDAALRNITMVNAAGDGGSGDEYPNGLPNVNGSHVNPFTLAAGGTSLSTVASAAVDETLTPIVAKAIAHDPDQIWKLVSGGLKTLPTKATSPDTLIETVWNSYFVSDKDGKHLIEAKNGEGGYLVNETGAGGVDTSQPQPSYQTAFGLHLATSDPRALPGRGVPDVAADSGGNMHYVVPTPNFETKAGATIHFEGGTSAAAPLWTSLLTQVNAIFNDQDLPQLGFMNDLLYNAAVIAPAAFNDITLGNNTSSFALGGNDYVTFDGKEKVSVTPTGLGYSASPGYDLVSGLGTPNGVLLARAMTWIAHAQMSFGDKPAVLDPGVEGWHSPVKQSLLVQTSASDPTKVVLDTNGDVFKFKSAASDKFAWTSQLAEQSLQKDFDPNLVKLFDKQSQGALVQDTVSSGNVLTVSIDKMAIDAPQGAFSRDYGFVDFSGMTDAAVRIARPVAVAETVGGADDQTAVVRIRQVSKADLSVQFFRVDDLSGRIDGLKPGDKGYKAAAHDRAYETGAGKTEVNGPGYGEYKQTNILDVDAGDIVAMRLKKGHKTYWVFAEANEKAHGEHVGHLWNYGVNTWGWEAGNKGGDHDFNDLIVQLDFTSAYGNAWLV